MTQNAVYVANSSIIMQFINQLRLCYPMFTPSPMFLRFYVFQFLCSWGSVCPMPYVPDDCVSRFLGSRHPMFIGSYVPDDCVSRVLGSRHPMFIGSYVAEVLSSGGQCYPTPSFSRPYVSRVLSFRGPIFAVSFHGPLIPRRVCQTSVTARLFKYCNPGNIGPLKQKTSGNIRP